MIGSAIRKLLGKYGAGKAVIREADNLGRQAKRLHKQTKRDNETYKDVVDSKAMHNFLAATGIKRTKKEARSIDVAKKAKSRALAKGATSRRAETINKMSAAEIKKSQLFKDWKKKNPEMTVRDFKKKISEFIDPDRRGKLKASMERVNRVKSRANVNRAARQGTTLPLTAIPVAGALSSSDKKDDRRYK